MQAGAGVKESEEGRKKTRRGRKENKEEGNINKEGNKDNSVIQGLESRNAWKAMCQRVVAVGTVTDMEQHFPPLYVLNICHHAVVIKLKTKHGKTFLDLNFNGLTSLAALHSPFCRKLTVSYRVILQLTVGQSVCLSWLRASSGTHDQIFAVGKTGMVLSVVGRSL
jgi:hypothetical protein